MIVMKKACPFLIDDNSIGLEAVMDFNSSVIVFFLNFYQSPEKIQAGQGGFASLKGKGSRMSHLIQRLFHENIQSLF